MGKESKLLKHLKKYMKQEDFIKYYQRELITVLSSVWQLIKNVFEEIFESIMGIM